MTVDKRQKLLKKWSLLQLDLLEADWSMVSGDASFRRYFRLEKAGQSWICVDAPLEHENSEQFIKVARMLAKVNAPKVIAYDLAYGFMLLSDLGDELYLPMLNNQSANGLYKAAIDALIEMQRIDSADELSAYDEQLLNLEMELFRDWFLTQHLQITLTDEENQMLDQLFKWLTDSALEQPQVFVHRDYHSRNIMYIENQPPGIIDFQDAVHGPISYDLLSLLRDCYIEWPDYKVDEWLSYFVEQSDWELDKEQFIQWFDWMGLQRHIKVAGIFARLNYRDGKSSYLKDIPLTLRYIVRQAEKYPQLEEFTHWMKQSVMPKMDSMAQIQ